jgi:DNA-binding transcriptional MerR regulator
VKSAPKDRKPTFDERPQDHNRMPANIMGNTFPLRQFLTIQQVSQRLDVPKPTLRFWEREFVGILVPLRTNGGQRRYAQEHVSIIEEIKMLKKAGLSLIEIKRKLGKGIDDSLIGRFDDWGKRRDGGQMSEAGRQKSGSERTDGIGLLAERVAEVVKMEVLRFFQRGEG